MFGARKFECVEVEEDHKVPDSVEVPNDVKECVLFLWLNFYLVHF